jgi:tetratricopeptide (TPR) repeat protein
VLSEPSGAQVFVGGEKQKDLTPLTIRDVIAGKTEVRVHKDGYYDGKEQVEVLPEKTVKLDVALSGGNLLLYEGEWLEPDEVEKRKTDAFNGHLSSAETAVKRGDFKSAKESLDKAAKIRPKAKELQQEKERWSREKVAAEEKARALALKREIDGLVEKGRQAEQADRLQDAFDLYQDALKKASAGGTSIGVSNETIADLKARIKKQQEERRLAGRWFL